MSRPRNRILMAICLAIAVVFVMSFFFDGSNSYLQFNDISNKKAAGIHRRNDLVRLQEAERRMIEAEEQNRALLKEIANLKNSDENMASKPIVDEGIVPKNYRLTPGDRGLDTYSDEEPRKEQGHHPLKVITVPSLDTAPFTPVRQNGNSNINDDADDPTDDEPSTIWEADFLKDSGDGPAFSIEDLIVQTPINSLIGVATPIVVHTSKGAAITSTLHIVVTGPIGPESSLKRYTLRMYRGAGSVSVVFDASGFYKITVMGKDFKSERDNEVYVYDIDQQRHHIMGGDLKGSDALWRSEEIVHVRGDLVIGPEQMLYIQGGVVVILDENVSIDVLGKISIQGSLDKIIFFTSSDPKYAWGEVTVHTKFSSKYTWFLGGGGDANKKFGHSKSQPVIRVLEDAALTMFGGGLIDNTGKGFGSTSASLDLEHVLISRCDTGGQLDTSVLHMTHCHVLEIPDADGILDDDDNDGIYLMGAHINGKPSVIKDSSFVMGEDDGIDHNEANIEVDGCWFERFTHEGIATSGNKGGSAVIRNSVFRKCGQGIEIGYGKQHVVVERCLLLDNSVGLRYGDEYSGWVHKATAEVRGTISLRNCGGNYRNYLEDPKTKKPYDILKNVQSECVMFDDANTAASQVFIHEFTGECFIPNAICNDSPYGPEQCSWPGWNRVEKTVFDMDSVGRSIREAHYYTSLGLDPQVSWHLLLETMTVVKIDKVTDQHHCPECRCSVKVDMSVKSCTSSVMYKVVSSTSGVSTNSLESRHYLKNVLAYYLDRVLGTFVVLPTRGKKIETSRIMGAKNVQIPAQIDKINQRTRCIRESDDPLEMSSLVWPNYNVKEQPLADGFQSETVDNYREYYMFSYIANCDKDDTQHTVVKNNYIMTDFSRCFLNETSSWESSITDMCDFPSDIVDVVHKGFSQKGFKSLAHHLLQTMENDELRRDIVHGLKHAFALIDQRASHLIKQIDRCKVRPLLAFFGKNGKKMKDSTDPRMLYDGKPRMLLKSGRIIGMWQYQRKDIALNIAGFGTIVGHAYGAGLDDSREKMMLDQGWAELASYHIGRLLSIAVPQVITRRRFMLGEINTKTRFDDFAVSSIKHRNLTFTEYYRGLSQVVGNKALVVQGNAPDDYVDLAISVSSDGVTNAPYIDMEWRKVLDQSFKVNSGDVLQHIGDFTDVIIFDYIVQNIKRHSSAQWFSVHGRFVAYNNGLSFWGNAGSNCVALFQCPPVLYPRKEKEYLAHPCDNTCTVDMGFCKFRKTTIDRLRFVGPDAPKSQRLSTLLPLMLSWEKEGAFDDVPIFPSRYGSEDDFYRGIMIRIGVFLKHVDLCISKFGTSNVMI